MLNSLEAIAVDYVKAFYELQNLEKAYEEYYHKATGLELMATNPARKEEVHKAREKVDGMLAALRSHVRAVYDL